MAPLFGPLAGTTYDYSKLGQQAGANLYGLPYGGQAPGSEGAAGAGGAMFGLRPARRPVYGRPPIRMGESGAAGQAGPPLPAGLPGAPAAPTAELAPAGTQAPGSLFGPFAQLGGYRLRMAGLGGRGVPRL